MNVRFSVDALHLIEDVYVDDSLPLGVTMGLGLMHGLLQKVAARAAKLNDPELNELMLRLHLYETEGEAAPEGGSDA